jgi:hypothetical protein
MARWTSQVWMICLGVAFNTVIGAAGVVTILERQAVGSCCCFGWQARALKVSASYQGGAIEGVIGHVWCPGQGWRQDYHSGS